MKKRVKCTTCHGKSEEKDEFGSLRNESLYFKEGTPIMLGLDLWMLEYVHDIFTLFINILEINLQPLVGNLIDLLEQYGLRKQIVIYMKNKMFNFNAMAFTLKSIGICERLGIKKSF
jgi:hypothetical protein